MTELTISHSFHQPLLPGVIPLSVTCVNYDSRSKHRLLDDSLPAGVKVLKVSRYFSNMFVPDLLPLANSGVSPVARVTSVDMCMFPISLEHLEIVFGGLAILDFSILPPRLHHLRITGGFNQKLVPGMLPASLKELILSQCHHLLEPGSLPEQLTRFTCYSFESPFTLGMFPASLRHIELWFCHHALVPGVIPFGVTDILIRPKLKRRFGPGIFPASVKRLSLVDRCTASHDSIPGSVTHFTIGVVKPGVIPSSVTHLTFDAEYDKHVAAGVIPSSVTHLKFGRNMKQPVTFDTIPHSVTHLVLSPLQLIDNPDWIPPSVTHVECPSSYRVDTSKIRYMLPSTVEHVWCNSLSFMKHLVVASGHVRVSTGTMPDFP